MTEEREVLYTMYYNKAPERKGAVQFNRKSKEVNIFGKHVSDIGKEMDQKYMNHIIIKLTKNLNAHQEEWYIINSASDLSFFVSWDNNKRYFLKNSESVKVHNLTNTKICFIGKDSKDFLSFEKTERPLEKNISVSDDIFDDIDFDQIIKMNEDNIENNEITNNNISNCKMQSKPEIAEKLIEKYTKFTPSFKENVNPDEKNPQKVRVIKKIVVEDEEFDLNVDSVLNNILKDYNENSNNKIETPKKNEKHDKIENNNLNSGNSSHIVNKLNFLHNSTNKDKYLNSLSKLYEMNSNNKRKNPFIENEEFDEYENKKSKRLKKATDNKELLLPLNTSCPICLDSINSLANLDNCNHDFCRECIVNWSTKTNLCPLCKKEFKKIIYYEKNKKKEIRVKKKRLEIEYDEQDLENLIDEADDNCMMCGSSHDQANLLVCDSCAYNVCHTYCDGLDRIPDEEWICNHCREEVLEIIEESENDYEEIESLDEENASDTNSILNNAFIASQELLTQSNVRRSNRSIRTGGRNNVMNLSGSNNNFNIQVNVNLNVSNAPSRNYSRTNRSRSRNTNSRSNNRIDRSISSHNSSNESCEENLNPQTRRRLRRR